MTCFDDFVAVLKCNLSMWHHLKELYTE